MESNRCWLVGSRNGYLAPQVMTKRPCVEKETVAPVGRRRERLARGRHPRIATMAAAPGRVLCCWCPCGAGGGGGGGVIPWIPWLVLWIVAGPLPPSRNCNPTTTSHIHDPGNMTIQRSTGRSTTCTVPSNLGVQHNGRAVQPYAGRHVWETLGSCVDRGGLQVAEGLGGFHLVQICTWARRWMRTRIHAPGGRLSQLQPGFSQSWTGQTRRTGGPQCVFSGTGTEQQWTNSSSDAPVPGGPVHSSNGFLTRRGIHS